MEELPDPRYYTRRCLVASAKRSVLQGGLIVFLKDIYQMVQVRLFFCWLVATSDPLVVLVPTRSL